MNPNTLTRRRAPPTGKPVSDRAPGAGEQPKEPASLRPAEVYVAFGSSPRGLSASDAARRLATAGPNALPPPPRRPIASGLLAQFTNLFAVVLLVASAITLGSYFLQTPHDAGNLELSVGILGVVLINASIGFFQEYSAERTAQALQAMVPRTARVLRGGERIAVPAADLVPGDVLLLEAGDAVCCDARLVEARDVAVTNVALTGESAPVRRVADAAAEGTPNLEARNLVFMGTSVIHGTAKAIAFATGSATEFGRIYRMTAQVPSEPSPLQRQVARMARQVSVVAITLAAGLFALRASTANARLVESFVFALGVMVALVPEGLPATLSVSLAIGVRRMAARHALIKRLVAVETLGSTTVICTDKTGTLTKAEMTVGAVWESGRRHNVSGVGYSPEGTVEDAGPVLDLLRVAALCSDARLIPPDGPAQSEWRVLGDTTEGAILVAAAKAGVDLAGSAARAPRVGVFPFDSERKLMTTVHRTRTGFACYVKGAPQEILRRCESIAWDGAEVSLGRQQRAAVDAANDGFAGEALRVLAVAYRNLDTDRPAQEQAESGLTFLGLVAMLDPPRPDVVEAVAACRAAGIKIIMVTGDYGLTAEAIARRVGIVRSQTPRVISGGELDALSDADLGEVLKTNAELVFARVRPEHKLRVVSILEETGEIVAVTGDGVNDAPALKRADIGVAMGITGTDVAREASLMVLLDDSFTSIAASVELGRSVYANIRKFLVYLFSHNIAELIPILAAALVGFPLVPLSALQVLSIDLGSDVLPALALGAERPGPGTMSQPPRPSKERLLSAPVVRRFLFLGAIQSLGVCFAFFWRIHSAHLGFAQFTASNPTYREARTMTQAGIVVSQFFNSFTVRSTDASVVSIGLLSNLPLVLAGLAGIVFVSCISYVPALERAFGTAALSAWDWLILIGFGAALLAADEFRKWIARRRGRRRSAPNEDLPQSGNR